VLGSRFEDRVHVERVSIAAQQLTSGRVAENRSVGVLDRLQQSLRHFVAILVELRVHARDDHIHLAQDVVGKVKIAVPKDIDLDPGEKAFLREVGVNVLTMKEIDRLGLAAVMEQAIELATRDTNGLHISFDMDAVDPDYAPGVGTRVAGGLTYREAHLSLELIADSGKMTSLEIVEVNPTLDHENRTAILAAELILSAFGKRIF